MRPINMKSGFLIIEIIICFLFMIYYMSIQASLVFLRKKDCYKTNRNPPIILSKKRRTLISPRQIQ